MHLHRGDGHGLQRIQDGHAGMGVRRGIDDDAVINAVGPLNDLYQFPFMVGLKEGRLRPGLIAGLPDKGTQGGEILFAVEFRFPDTQHVQIGSVDDQQLFSHSSSISLAAAFGLPLFSAR